MWSFFAVVVDLGMAGLIVVSTSPALSINKLNCGIETLLVNVARLETVTTISIVVLVPGLIK